jgi:hypothetical protein
MPPQAVILQRATTRPLSLNVLDRLVAVHAAAGATEEVARAAMRLLALDPLREDVHRLRRPRAAAVCLDALARAEALGMRPLAARCQATLGELWERSGDLERARHARAAAAELRQELGLVFGTEAVAARG